MEISEPVTSEYVLPVFPYRTPPELSGGQAVRYDVVIIGAGITGLTLACDLASRGVKAIVLDEDDTVGVRGASSRGIVYVQKTLEIFDRLGIYNRVAERGVKWSIGRSLVGYDEVIYTFDAAADNVSSQPPFINIQQFYVEWFLVDRIAELGGVDLRWKNRVTSIVAHDDHSTMTVSTPDGEYSVEANWVIDCAGINSTARNFLSLPTHSSKGDERWCISDVRFTKNLPLERWTWVTSPVADGRAVWQHPMADNVWRIDFQMAPDSDLEYVSRPDVCAERVKRLLGPGIDFELIWVGPYAYRSHMLDEFRHRNILFAGDAAHVFPPLGARGGNSGIHDADNIGWKLALVLSGKAPCSLMDSYSTERRPAALYNSHVANQSLRFLSPGSPQERLFRDAVITLAKKFPWAQKQINTGRLCHPFTYSEVDTTVEGGDSIPNIELERSDGKAIDLVSIVRGRSDFTLFVAQGWKLPESGTDTIYVPLTVGEAGTDVVDPHGLLRAHLKLAEYPYVLVRPDLHVAARLSGVDGYTLAKVLDRIRGKEAVEVMDQ